MLSLSCFLVSDVMLVDTRPDVDFLVAAVDEVTEILTDSTRKLEWYDSET